jgi:hypothetical protein
MVKDWYLVVMYNHDKGQCMVLKYFRGDIFMYKPTGELYEITQGRLNCGFPYYYAKDIETNTKLKLDQYNLSNSGNYLKLGKAARLLYGYKEKL